MGGVKTSDFAREMAVIMPRLLREVSRRQEGVFTRGNLAVSDIIVMDALLEKGPCTMSDLACILNLSMSAATVIVDRMTKKGLVRRERSREDRRIVMVTLLKKGKETIKKVNDQRRNIVVDLYSALDDAERAQYLKLLKKVYSKFIKK